MKNLVIGLIMLTSMVAQSQTLNANLNSKDMATALKMLGVETMKYDFDAADSEYKLVLYLEELVKDSIIKEMRIPFVAWENAANKEVSIISKISSDTAGVYWFTMIHPGMETMQRFVVPKEYRQIHFWMQVEQEEIVYDNKTPLVFYGMAWEAERNGRMIREFCWGENVGRDMSNKSLENIEHMILISYELVRLD